MRYTGPFRWIFCWSEIRAVCIICFICIMLRAVPA